MTGPVFDAHFHVVDPRFPLVPDQGFVPEPFDVESYRRAVTRLGVVGGAVVAGSFQGFDSSWLADALASLGSAFVGVAQLPPTVADEEVCRLDALGVRAVRANLHRGGRGALEGLEALAGRVWEVAGWHVEVYLDARHLDELGPSLARLPRVCVDHLGLSAAGLAHLLDLVEGGAWVKASGFGRVDFDVPKALRGIAAANPAALLFGTDLPSTRAPRPFHLADVDLLSESLGDEGLVRRVLHDNAMELYRPKVGTTP